LLIMFLSEFMLICVRGQCDCAQIIPIVTVR
jgi:hypothetical protein